MRLIFYTDWNFDMPSWFPLVITLELKVYFILLLWISLRLNRRQRRKSHFKIINEPASHIRSFRTELPRYTALPGQRNKQKTGPAAVNTQFSKETRY